MCYVLQAGVIVVKKTESLGSVYSDGGEELDNRHIKK